MAQAFFITGTDTEIGKTHATCALLATAIEQGLRAVGLKPVAAGTDSTGQNDDVTRLMASSNVVLPKRTVNPWLLSNPLSPHIAARLADIEITTDPIRESFKTAQSVADFILVEGVGGLYAPLSDSLSQPDIIKALDIPVILVIGLRLGCLNHALLTAAAIKHHNLRFSGWIGNHIDPDFMAVDDNIRTLQKCLEAPCLGILPFQNTAANDSLASYLSLPQ